uniref:Uroplakin 3B n=1 Tax=Chelydra serpentina TaxID=8475 RepID=A0A8C3RXN3_CHESE
KLHLLIVPNETPPTLPVGCLFITIDYVPEITLLALEGKNTSSTFVLEQPRCVFNDTVSDIDEIWLVVSLSNAGGSVIAGATDMALPWSPDGLATGRQMRLASPPCPAEPLLARDPAHTPAASSPLIGDWGCLWRRDCAGCRGRHVLACRDAAGPDRARRVGHGPTELPGCHSSDPLEPSLIRIVSVTLERVHWCQKTSFSSSLRGCHSGVTPLKSLLPLLSIRSKEFHLLFTVVPAAISRFTRPTSLQSLPAFQQFPENPNYMTLGTSSLNYPCDNGLGQITVLRVGNETGCVFDTSRPDCNGPLPGPGPYR